ncbi:MBL fold metallo-hydrolase [Bradyrhizobium sp. CSA207]|uniref:MBL fold metallo-hydrolase n=1 Tax=Bradyrhizobium sp. CSA207 TaxID=2698826 RepID=UPI0023AFE025|nr:MBL fold metallo-hydrolase [Bradyrhizobium sp. CSA207]MDE5444688.1 MBL fold metallo-hydrolase [Bradyrhizobium sp. CSA207]
MANRPYEKGLHDLGNGCFAWLVPDGSWGYSNAGLIVDSGETLLVDTLFDLKSTREMLDQMHRQVPASGTIGTLVNTHANGDHTFGNQLVRGARIVATSKCRDEMLERPPEFFRNLFGAWRALGDAGAFMHEVMGSRFDLSDIVAAPPTTTFDGSLSLNVGNKSVELIEVGPAHTPGDLLVHVPQDRTVFTGDIMFVKGHPIVWAGPISNWIAACDRILSRDVETIVPGHGAITDRNGVRELKCYLEYVLVEARKRYDAGMNDEEAANDISMERFKDWGEPERLVVNVDAAYREFEGQGGMPDPMRLFGLMAKAHFARNGCPACKGSSVVHTH